MPKYHLRLRKISFFLIFRSSAISLGSNKAFFKDEATWHPIPPLKLLIVHPFSGVHHCAWGLEAKPNILKVD